MPEYPDTSAKGVAYCVDVTGMDKVIAKELHENVSTTSSICIPNVYKIHQVQYGHNSTGHPHDVISSSVYLGGIRVQRTTYHCTGIWCCEYAHSSLYRAHSSWTEANWLKKRQETYDSQKAFMEEWNPWAGQEETLQ